MGEEVGYKVRFNNKTTGDKTRLLYMTDGMLPAEMQSDRELSRYNCIIIDEVHERSLSTELLLTLIHDVLRKRDDLKLIIMSATMDSLKFRRFFTRPDGTPAHSLEAGGFSHTVKIHNIQSIGSAPDFIQSTFRIASMIHATKPAGGDILVFLPGEDEILAVAAKLQKRLAGDINVSPCYSTLSDQQQQEVFKPTADGVKKIVLATNIAETSLTIDGIVYVIDCGLSKQAIWNPRVGGTMLERQHTSRVSAQQRSGRARRTQSGEAYRLYTVEHWERTMDSTA